MTQQSPPRGGIGVAIRRSQEALIKTRADGGWNARNLDDRVTEKKSPSDIFAGHEEDPTR